jgi:outer membrane receptor protein involved in Fe transport
MSYSVHGSLPAASLVLALALHGGAPAFAQEPEEVLVTVTRRERPLSAVAASASAFTERDIEALGAKSFADIARYTPGISFDEFSGAIAIRGLSSDAGAGTTGIYIDETPIQMRALYYGTKDTLPAVFDLERVEILRGPQGTLFGAGSEGGTIRYVTGRPSLTDSSFRVRSEFGASAGAGPNYEAGLVYGVPLVTDTLGLRVSAWMRREGGWVDRIDSGSGALLEEDSNRTDTFVLRAALGWAPLPGLLITPSINFQKREQHNAGRYWLGLSAPANGIFRSGTPERLGDQDRFVLPSLTLNYNLGGTELIGTVSYFDRLQRLGGYSATLYNLSYFQQLIDPDRDGGPVDPFFNPCPQCRQDLYPLLTPAGTGLPGYGANSIITNGQKNFTAEVRLQSTDPSSRFTWVAGLFYARNRQESIDRLYDPQLPAITSHLFGISMADAWGVELLPGDIGFFNRTVAHDSQLAAYADATAEILPGLRLEAGLRLARTEFDFDNMADGPENYGPTAGSGRQSETPFSPKLGLSYTLPQGPLVYAGMARGYRIGGANAPFPEASCRTDLDALGLARVPQSYNSDSATSYEIGARDRLLENRLTLAGSAFYVEWNRIQQQNYLPSCGFQYTANLGRAVSKGFDLELQFRPLPALLLNLSGGYTEARYAADTHAGADATTPLLVADGDTLGGAPWTLAAGAQYSFLVGDWASFVRADYAFAARNPWTEPAHNPATSAFDPGLSANPATSHLSLRAGTALGKWELEVFVQNLLDAHPQLDLTHQDAATLLYEASTLRPRTFGMSLSYRTP